MVHSSTRTHRQWLPSPPQVCSLHLAGTGRANPGCAANSSAQLTTQGCLALLGISPPSRESPSFPPHILALNSPRTLNQGPCYVFKPVMALCSRIEFHHPAVPEGFSPRRMRLAADLILFSRLPCNLLFDTSLIFLSLCTEISWSGKLFHCGVSCVWITDLVWVALVVRVDQKEARFSIWQRIKKLKSSLACHKALSNILNTDLKVNNTEGVIHGLELKQKRKKPKCHTSTVLEF